MSEESFHIDQYELLYRLDEWNTHRTNQNCFLEYRSWSGVFQTLSMFVNQCNLSLREILILSPIQIEAVELSRSGLWAECFDEFVYEGVSLSDDFQEIIGECSGLNDLRCRRTELLYRSENQVKPKLVIIVSGELLNPKQLKDCNKYLRMQTLVCFDSARRHPADSIVNYVKHPLKHLFLNEDVDEIQRFLYQCLQKRLIPLSKDPNVRVFEYNRAGRDLSKLPHPLFSCDPFYQDRDVGVIKRGDLVYTDNYNWKYSLEGNRYYLTKGLYLVIDSIRKRDGEIRVSSHPTYTNYRFRIVPDVKYVKVGHPQWIEDCPPWKFKRGGILVPKILQDVNDARRLYWAVNQFRDQVHFYIT